MSLTILPLKQLKEKDDKKLKKIPYPLPKPSFLMIVSAPVRSGKTVFISNLLLNKNFGYKEYFGDNIIYISPTIENDNTGKMGIMKSNDIIKITDNLTDIDNILESIVDLQKEQGEDMKPLLIILDDMLGFIKPNSYFDNLCSKYRHYKLSIIITTQSFRKLPTICRYNTNSYILFKSHNKKEYQKFEEEFEGNYENFEKIYKDATKEKYNFLYLDLENITGWHNFTNQLK